MSTLQNAFSAIRKSLKLAPLACATVLTLASVSTFAQSSEWVGRSVGTDATRALMAGNTNSYAVSAASTLASGSSYLTSNDDPFAALKMKHR